MASLAAGIRLGVFGALADGARDAAAGAPRSARPRAARGSSVAKDGATDRLAPAAAEHLVPGKPTYVGDVANILANPAHFSEYAQLDRVVKNGGTLLGENAETPDHPFGAAFAESSAAMAFPGVASLEAIVGEHLACEPARSRCSSGRARGRPTRRKT